MTFTIDINTLHELFTFIVVFIFGVIAGSLVEGRIFSRVKGDEKSYSYHLNRWIFFMTLSVSLAAAGWFITGLHIWEI